MEEEPIPFFNLKPVNLTRKVGIYDKYFVKDDKLKTVCCAFMSDEKEDQDTPPFQDTVLAFRDNEPSQIEGWLNDVMQKINTDTQTSPDKSMWRELLEAKLSYQGGTLF